jgi:hypothetical protein
MSITTADAPPTPATSDAISMPRLTQPQLLAFATFLVFIVFAIIASGKADATVQPSELNEIRLFALFLIAALLPSDVLIRFGRNLLFQSLPQRAEGASPSDAPATTLAQWLAFAAFLIVAVLTLISNKIVSTGEFGQINDVARVLVLALLPSDAGVRFARALYYRSPRTPVPTSKAAKHI